MLSRTRLTSLVPLLAIAALAEPPPAVAQRPSAAQRLGELRARMHAYDTGPDGTTRVVQALGELAREAPPREASEARFLRAIATADLSIIARRRRDPALANRLAAAFGADATALRAELRAELEALRYEPYLAVVEDALAALTPPDEIALPPAEGEHTRERAVVFTRVIDQLMAEDEALEVLADLAADPCPPAAACPPPYQHFGAHGRRAIAAMTALHELLRSVERTAELGDPFSAALAREVLVDTVVLRSIMLAPHDWAAQVRPLGARVGAPLDADAAVVVTREGVRAGWAPEVHWDREGRALLVADGPLLGSDATVPIGATVDTYARPIRHVAAHVASRVRGAARVVVIVEPGVEAHILTRVLMSLEAARIRPHLLALAAEDGTAQGVALETVTEDDGAVGVFVRMGGFSARQRGRSVSLPRRRAAERWVFDFDGLDVATRERVRHPVTLRYMGTVAADLVLRVALRLASVDRPVRLVVPTAAPMEER